VPPVPDTTILSWRADFRADDTNSPSQDDWETGVQRDLDDEFRNIKSVVRAWSQPANKVWQAVEKPNTIQWVQHATYGFSVKVEFINIVDRLEPLQILKAVRGSNTYYFVVTSAAMEGANTIIQVRSLPVQFKTTWSSITGGDTIVAGFSLADPGFTQPFTAYVAGSPPVTGKQGLVIFDDLGHMSSGICDQIADDSISTYFKIPALLSQGRITAVSQIKQTWAINVYPYIATDTFVDQIYLGTKPSLFAKSNQSGQAVITGNGSAGPYVLSNFPRAEPDTSYALALQVKATTIATPTVNQLSWRVSARDANHFELTANATIPAGATVTFDWMLTR
jgi:hypothetical protein